MKVQGKYGNRAMDLSWRRGRATVQEVCDVAESMKVVCPGGVLCLVRKAVGGKPATRRSRAAKQLGSEAFQPFLESNNEDRRLAAGTQGSLQLLRVGCTFVHGSRGHWECCL